MASVTSMTSMRSSVSGKGRMGVDDAILEREESGSEGGYDEDDDHEYSQRRGAEAEGGEEQMRHRIAENMRQDTLLNTRSPTWTLQLIRVEEVWQSPRRSRSLCPPSATVPQYDAGYMRSGKEWDGSREWEREELGQSKRRCANAMSPSTSRPPSSSTRPNNDPADSLLMTTSIPLIPNRTLPYPPLSSSASLVKAQQVNIS
ncbi:hypothetical protein FA13DRAFT_1184803 [Coprinellus micaceus]|uniref:Uncharacterized protein n=1 Tax=Coprinellus micaceus TaxID=71717 RepID=A0A4Y7RD53_COPMI|nr:hypothetical protein FA13DRAFT_1184803 [Coprinellus micaceus]